MDLAGKLRVDFTRSQVFFRFQNWEGFLSAELEENGLLDFAEDAFSLAVWSAWLLSGTADWKEDSRNTLKGSLSRTDLSGPVIEKLTQLLVRAWHPDPLERPDVNELLAFFPETITPSQTVTMPGGPDLSRRGVIHFANRTMRHRRGIVPPILSGKRSVLKFPEQVGPLYPSRENWAKEAWERCFGQWTRRTEQWWRSNYCLLSILRMMTRSSGFKKKARMLAQVNHPNITNLVEINQDQESHYLVLEYVSGCDLKRVLEEVKPLPELAALKMIQQVCQGAGRSPTMRGIIHRDLKPGNLLLQFSQEDMPTTPEQWRILLEQPGIKLTDFGLARHVVQTDSLAMTQTGNIYRFPPYYMSPEQCRGKRRNFRPQRDVYALGITLF